MDIAYEKIDYKQNEILHNYGPNVHIMSDAVSLSQLAYLSSHDCVQPNINSLVRELYHFLIRSVVGREFPLYEAAIKTRMIDYSDKGIWHGKIIDKNIKVITVNVLRAGSLASQVSFDFFAKLLNPNLIRQDHILMSRVTDDEEKVTGAHMSASKIGGDIKDAFVFFPDPMGATGSSLIKVIHHYKENVQGPCKKIFALHLIITPEYIKNMQKHHPDVKIYALRIDRGASSKKALNSIPGQYLDEESGLTEKDYIIPGAGGFGELINNSFV